MSHAGLENGYLKATYNQLEDSGIARCYINKSIQEAVILGLVEYIPGLRISVTKNYMNTFRLTYLKYKYWDDNFKRYEYNTPTDEWLRINENNIEEVKNKIKNLNKK
jgi:hypothetical protein